MKLIKVNKNALASFNNILSMSNELQQVQDADWFDTPEKRLQWWLDLEAQWKQAFCEGVFFNQVHPASIPADENLIHLFELTELSLCGNWKSNARRNNNPDIELALTNLNGLKNLTNLIRLEVDYNGYIESLEPLSNHHNLETFWFDNNIVKDLSPLMGLRNLSGISVWNNKVDNLEPLASIPNLSDITLSLYGFGNPVQDYEPLKNIVNLKLVYAHKGKINAELEKQLAGVTIRVY